MELSLITSLIADPAKLISKIESTRQKDDGTAKLYDPENHDITDCNIRKKREVFYPVMDANGVQETDPTSGDVKLRRVYEEVARITSAAQKQIVTWAVQIAAGVPVEIQADPANATETKMVALLKKTLKDNKMEYLDQEILRLTAIYKICAEIWYSEPVEPNFWGDLGNKASKFRMRLMILSEENGDILYPVKDNTGNMVALGRAYKIRDDEDKEISMFDLFLHDGYTTFKQDVTGWTSQGKTPTKYGKANFIVHQQARREWDDVQPKIARLETLDSNHADQNDATGSPILAVSGKIEGFGKRGETGKVFELENGSDIKVVESTGAPESIKMERENLVKGIFDETNTPQISFSEAQGFGANIPGITIKLLFLPATLKALGRQSGGWGMSVQRRYNFLKSAMAVINTDVASAVGMDISPLFSIYMPSNDTERYQNIVSLVGAGLMSKETALQQLAFTSDPVAEFEKIKKEAAEAAKLVPGPVVPPMPLVK
ncbi:MAG: phage portal protein [Mucilaginibacter sp.]|uniref:phage portal protein n=1 Tax=Mucilaginibacter sp. TaxID=1882438 RepID=UPI003265A6E1